MKSLFSRLLAALMCVSLLLPQFAAAQVAIDPGARGSAARANASLDAFKAEAPDFMRGLGVPVPPVTPQPTNWNFSWHENPFTVLADGSIILAGSDNLGQFIISKMTITGKIVGTKTFGPLISSSDDHNAVSYMRTAGGSALVAMLGHADSYQSGAVKNEIRIARATSGDPFDAPAHRSQQIVISLLTGEIPNYVQTYQIPSGPFVGRIMVWYNDDTSSSWRCYFSDDDGLTWLRGRMAWQGASIGQVYQRLDTAAVFTGPLAGSGYTSTFLPIYAFNHPAKSHVILRYIYLDLTNGKLYRGDTGVSTSNNASIFAQTTQESAVATLSATASNFQDVRVVDFPVSQRIHMVHKGIVYGTQMTPAADFLTYTNVQHFIRKNGVDYYVGAAGKPFWQPSSYNPDIQPAREAHAGDRVYRAYNDGTAYNSGAALDRIDWPNGIENGGAVTTRLLTAGVTPGIAADEAIMRFFPVEGSAAPYVIGVALVGKYTDFQNWTGCHYVTVFGPAQTSLTNIPRIPSNDNNREAQAA